MTLRKKEVILLCLTLKKIAGEKPITLLAILADFKDMFNNCGICGVIAVCVLVYFLSDGTQ